MSEFGQKWVRMTQNGTNAGHFQIRFQYILARWPEKVPDLSYLGQYEPLWAKSDIPGLYLSWQKLVLISLINIKCAKKFVYIIVTHELFNYTTYIYLLYSKCFINTTTTSIISDKFGKWGLNLYWLLSKYWIKYSVYQNMYCYRYKMN